MGGYQLKERTDQVSYAVAKARKAVSRWMPAEMASEGRCTFIWMCCCASVSLQLVKQTLHNRSVMKISLYGARLINRNNEAFICIWAPLTSLLVFPQEFMVNLISGLPHCSLGSPPAGLVPGLTMVHLAVSKLLTVESGPLLHPQAVILQAVRMPGLSQTESRAVSPTLPSQSRASSQTHAGN